MTKLVTTTYALRERLIKQEIKDWSLAILVPTKKMTRQVSDNFRQPPARMKEILHSAVIDMKATILGAEIIAFLMQPNTNKRHFEEMINLLCQYFQGKGGDEPTQTALKEAANIRKAYEDLILCQATDKNIRKKSIIISILDTYNQTRTLSLTGDPDKDWQSMRRILEDGSCKRLKEIAEEVKNIRILDRGTQLRQALSQDWRDNGAYFNALSITRQSYMQEHFSTNSKPERGVVVMNMHKAKGKQFDEVIIFEGWPRFKGGKIIANIGRIVYNNEEDKISDQARQNMRVSVTRGKSHVTILTPKGDPCVLIREQI